MPLPASSEKSQNISDVQATWEEVATVTEPDPATLWFLWNYLQMQKLLHGSKAAITQPRLCRGAQAGESSFLRPDDTGSTQHGARRFLRMTPVHVQCEAGAWL